MLALVDLHGVAGRRVGGFSFGMRQRLSLAAALLGDPDVLVLDEPATGLDPEHVRWLRDFLRGLGGEGRTVLVSSHILAEVAQTVDRVVIINQGRLVTQADIGDVEAQASPVVRVHTPEHERLLGLLGERGLSVTTKRDGSLEVRGTTAEEIGRIVRDEAILLTGLYTERSTLEDAFLALTTGTDDERAPS